MQKRLIVIDPNIIMESPTMRSWITSLESFAPLFSEIEVWATQCEVADHPKVKWVSFKKVKPWALQAMVFSREVSRRINKAEVWPPENTIVHTSGFYATKADIRFLHFSNTVFAEEVAKRQETLKLSFLRRLLVNQAIKEEKKVANTPESTKHWWVVSRKLGGKIHRELGHGTGSLSIIPNAYNPKRFSSKVREQYRETMREQYGFSSKEIVFAFSSFAHFERKGLLQAIEAVELARKEGAPFRVLVLGGSGQTVTDFRKKVMSKGLNDDFAVYAGLVSEIEQHLSATEALLFPSHFEAFSLAEIEAGALGLRLYLTAHYGAEMILRDPDNGRWLPWDTTGMKEVLLQDWKEGKLGTFHNEVGEAIPEELYAENLTNHYKEVLSLM